MKEKKIIDIVELFESILGEKVKEFDLPPPSFTLMQAEVVEFNVQEKKLVTKIPVSESWQNPYGTMQGGFISAAIDNAVGPLSMLVAPLNMTRTMQTKYIKAITTELDYIYIEACLIEEKKKRLTFEVVVMDEERNIYTTASVVNWMVG